MINVEIYKKGENTPICITVWEEFIVLIPENISFEEFTETYEFYRPMEKVNINAGDVYYHLKQLRNLKEKYEYMNTYFNY